MSNKYLSGFISIVGQPNVGKSTLLNTLAGEKVAIVSDKPQTTRNKINAVITTDEYQMVFIDTPGIHAPKSKLGEYMVKSAEKNVDGVDIVLFLVPPRAPSNRDLYALEKVSGTKSHVFLVINKIDTIQKDALLRVIDEYRQLREFKEIICISALTGENLDMLRDVIIKYLPEGPQYYDADYITDQPEKQIVAEIIREKALLSLDEEIPHGIAVVVESMKRREERNLIDCNATIFCERDSHKGMIIGKKGVMLKKIGTKARTEIELLLGTPMNLQLWVKVKKDWRNSDFLVKNFGYDKKKI